MIVGYLEVDPSYNWQKCLQALRNQVDKLCVHYKDLRVKDLKKVCKIDKYSKKYGIEMINDFDAKVVFRPEKNEIIDRQIIKELPQFLDSDKQVMRFKKFINEDDTWFRSIKGSRVFKIPIQKDTVNNIWIARTKIHMQTR